MFYRLIPPLHGGPWLLCVDGRNYAVDPRLGRRLAELGDGAPDTRSLRRLTQDESEIEALRLLLSGRMKHPPTLRGGRRLRWRLPLLPASFVEAVSGMLAPWTSTPALVALALLGIVSGLAAWRITPVVAAESTGALGHAVAATAVFLATALWHEFGHGAALRRGGYPVGVIGFGLLGLFPVFFCDVTAAAVLPRAGRLRVDLAGCVFQLAAGGLLLLHGRLGGNQVVALAGLGALIAVAWSLVPLPGTDGRWLLTDLLDSGGSKR